VSSNRLTRVK